MNETIPNSKASAQKKKLPPTKKCSQPNGGWYLQTTANKQGFNNQNILKKNS